MNLNNLNKIEKLLDNADGALITSPHNLRYFSGFAGGEGIALVGRDFKYLFVDSRYTEEARTEAPEFDVIEFKAGSLCAEINSRLKSCGVSRLCFEDNELTVSEFQRYSEKLIASELCPIGDRADTVRMVKTDEEIEHMRRAEKIGDIALGETLPMISAGVRECDIAAELEYRMRRLGAEGASFDTIVVSGAKSAMPHGRPDEKPLESGDLVTIDFGCIYKGYCSDMTRTFAIGDISDEKKKIYDSVLSAQLTGLSAIRAGEKASDCDRAAREVIESAGFGKYFGHSLGHGVGLKIHELPNLSPRSEVILKENMIVTCEPGIYIGGIGGVRIEDMVAVKENGYENLSSFTKELIICS